jgi:hypothetical protein
MLGVGFRSVRAAVRSRSRTIPTCASAPKNFLKVGIDETRTVEARLKPSQDPRLPLPGTPLIRRYQGKDVIVHVRSDGAFECDGRIYKSLSKAVTEATGTRWNGFAFYNLGHRPGVKRGEQE